MHARRWSFRIALVAILLAAGGCHHKKASPGNSGDVGPDDLKLDMANTPRPKTEPTSPSVAGTLGLTLEELKKRWNAKAPAHHTPKITTWQRQNIPAFQSWRAGARLSPNIMLDVIGVGKDSVQAALVSAAMTSKEDLQSAFNAWETLREATTPDISRDQLYKGLGLLSKPRSRVRFLDEGGYVWQFTYAPRRRAPEAQLDLMVRRAQPKPDPEKPFSMLVPLHKTPKLSTMGSFTLVYSPSSRGKTFEEAAKTCDQQGLSLCTDPQWKSACAEFDKISVFSTWTASFNKDLTKLQTRGGGKACVAGGPANAADKDPKRGAICCTRNVAMTGDQQAMRGLYAMPALQYEQAVDSGNKAGLLATLAPHLRHFYTLDNADRKDAIKFVMDDAAKHPGRWSEHQTCELRAANRSTYYALDCRRDIFQGEQGMAVMTEYGISKNRIDLVHDQKVLRKLGPM